MKIYSQRLAVLIIFVFALLVRIAFAWPALTGAELFVMGDDDDYYRLGVSIAQSGALADNGHLTAYRMPLFPITTAPFYFLFGTAPHAAQPFVVVLSALICVGVYLLGRELFQPRVGLVAALLAAVNLQLVLYSRVLMTETLFILLVLMGMLALERVRKTERWAWAVVAGIVLGLATLTRANFGPFVAAALVWLLYNRRSRIRPALRDVAIIATIVGLCWGAWVVRNYHAFGTFIPFTTQGGLAYYGIYNDAAASAPLPRFGNWLDIGPPIPSNLAQGATELTVDRLAKEAAFAWIRLHPLLAAKIALMQAVYFWWPDLIDPLFLALVPASVVGFVLAIRQHHQGVMLWAILAGVFTLMAIVSVGVGRYQVPMYPIFCVLAAMPLVKLWETISVRLAPGSPISQNINERV